MKFTVFGLLVGLVMSATGLGGCIAESCGTGWIVAACTAIFTAGLLILSLVED